MKPKRRQLLHLAAATTLGAGGALGMIQRVLAAGLEPVAPGVYRVRGDAKVNGRPAVPGLPVLAGDTVETGADGEIVYVIGQDAYLQRANSRVSFGGEAAADALRVLTGKLLSVFGKGAKRLATPNATIGIRGTGCYIETEAERTYFCLCYGEADVAPSATPGDIHRYATRYHDKPYYIANTLESVMNPARVINHTDAELTMLEALCGRRPPFYGQNYEY